MSMEKQNVAQDGRTPTAELTRTDEHWDKTAAEEFDPMDLAVEMATPTPNKTKQAGV